MVRDSDLRHDKSSLKQRKKRNVFSSWKDRGARIMTQEFFDELVDSVRKSMAILSGEVDLEGLSGSKEGDP